VALKKLAGIEGQDSDKEQISWLEFKKDETEVQESTEKGKQREQRSDEAEKEGQVERQEDENCKGTLSEAPVTLQYSREGVLSRSNG